MDSIIKSVGNPTVTGGGGGGGVSPQFLLSAPTTPRTPLLGLKEFVKGLPVPIYMKLVQCGHLHQSGGSILKPVLFENAPDFFTSVRTTQP